VITMRACSSGTPNTIARSRRGLTAPPARRATMHPSRRSYSPTAARGSIGTPAMRCTQVSNLTTVRCSGKSRVGRRLAADLAVEDDVRRVEPGARRIRFGGGEAAGDRRQHLPVDRDQLAASFAAATLSATTTATISPTWHTSGRRSAGAAGGRPVSRPCDDADVGRVVVLICGSGLRPSARTSSEVSTASTLGAARAAVTSSDRDQRVGVRRATNTP